MSFGKTPLLKDVISQGGYSAVTEGCRKLSGLSVSSLKRRVSSANFFGIQVPKNFFYVVNCCLFCMFSSLSTILVNRHLFKHYAFPVIFATWGQMIASVILSVVFGEIGRANLVRSLNYWPRFSWNPWTAIRLLPIVLLYIPRVLLTSFAIEATQVSTYNVTRSTSIVFSAILSYLILKLKPTVLSAISCGMIALSVVVTSFDGLSLSPAAFFHGITGSLCVALYFVVIKWFFPIVGNCQCTLLNYNCVATFFILIPIMLATGEFTAVARFFPSSDNPATENFVKVWFYFVFSLITGFLINISSMLLIKATSPVTYDVVGAVKGLLQAAIGIVLMGDVKSMQNIAGVCLSLVGGVLFAKGKHMEHLKKVEAANKEAIRQQDVEAQKK